MPGEVNYTNETDNFFHFLAVDFILKILGTYSIVPSFDSNISNIRINTLIQDTLYCTHMFQKRYTGTQIKINIMASTYYELIRIGGFIAARNLFQATCGYLLN